MASSLHASLACVGTARVSASLGTGSARARSNKVEIRSSFRGQGLGCTRAKLSSGKPNGSRFAVSARRLSDEDMLEAMRGVYLPQPPASEADPSPKQLTYTGPPWFPPPESRSSPTRMGAASPAQVEYGGYDEHRAKTPPPDLPSLLLDSRIVFLGMPLVPAVTELICAELIYLQYKDPRKPIYMYINSTGTTRADGETVGFETEGTAIYDAMRQVSNPVYTVNIGVCAGQSALLLAAGKKGMRYCLPHATTLLQMPSMPGSGQQTASDMVIKSNEIMDQYSILLELLSLHSGNSPEQLNKWMQNPFYMTPTMAIKYGFADKILDTQAIQKAKSTSQWDKEAGLRVVERRA